jgi:hypothetical protein
MKALSVAVLVLSVGAARADVVEVEYSGTVVDAINPTAGESLGAKVHGRMSIDLAAAPADLFPDDPSYGLYASTPFGSRAVDFVLGSRKHFGESNDYVLVQNDTDNGDVFTVADRSGRGTADAFSEFLQVAKRDLFDDDGMRQSIRLTKAEEPSFFFGIIESGIGAAYHFVQFALDRVSIKPLVCRV